MERGASADAETDSTLPFRGYRPHIDGLRAVAVYLVVAFHAGVDRLPGGFIGVDMFFVLSGYLVTQLLLRDLAGGGAIRLGRFYARRVRRLLPAAAVVLAATAVVFVAVGAPAEWSDAGDGIRASTLYVSNWFFIARSADYFAADVAGNPVLHFWSLSVEEQFYLLWPILLLGLFRATRRLARPGRAVQVVVAAAALLSLSGALLVARHDLDRAYYGTDTRAYQLLAGALLALVPGVLLRVGRRLHGLVSSTLALGSLAALVVVASWWVEVGAVQRGVLAAGLTVVTLVALESTDAGFGRRLLSVPPLVYLGRISYGTYLWHWLVVMVLARELELTTSQTLVVTVVGASALASLSYELLELPIRRSPALDLRRGQVIAAGLAGSLLVGLIIAPRVLHQSPGAGQQLASGAAGATVDAAAVEVDWRDAQDDVADMPDCTAAAPESCAIATGSGEHVLLIGDSHARMFIPTFRDLAERRDLQMSAAVLPECPWVQGVRYASVGPECIDAQNAWYGEILTALAPDVVVLAHRAVDDPASAVPIVGDETGRVGSLTPEGEELLRVQSAATVDHLRARDLRVVIIEPVPVTADDSNPLDCLSTESDVAACRFVANARPTPQEQAFRELAADDQAVWSLDLDASTCPYLPICDPVVDGIVVRRDNTHITTRYARTLVDLFEQYFVGNGIVR
jgi:peptidoglycan/LPS O-acetylase OafA/YrhL